MPKTCRLADVVKVCGRPAVYLAWSAPMKDPAFQRALQQRKVLTLHQEIRGGKKDHGVVGFEPGAHAQYLLFPRSLRAFAKTRIVAIDYALLEGEAKSGARGASPARSESRRSRNPGSVALPAPSPSNLVAFGSTAKTPPRPDLQEEAGPAGIPPRILRKIPAAVRAELRRALADVKAGKLAEGAGRIGALLG